MKSNALVVLSNLLQFSRLRHLVMKFEFWECESMWELGWSGDWMSDVECTCRKNGKNMKRRNKNPSNNLREETWLKIKKAFIFWRDNDSHILLTCFVDLIQYFIYILLFIPHIVRSRQLRKIYISCFLSITFLVQKVWRCVFYLFHWKIASEKKGCSIVPSNPLLKTGAHDLWSFLRALKILRKFPRG